MLGILAAQKAKPARNLWSFCVWVEALPFLGLTQAGYPGNRQQERASVKPQMREAERRERVSQWGGSESLNASKEDCWQRRGTDKGQTKCHRTSARKIRKLSHGAFPRCPLRTDDGGLKTRAGEPPPCFALVKPPGQQRLRCKLQVPEKNWTALSWMGHKSQNKVALQNTKKGDISFTPDLHGKSLSAASWRTDQGQRFWST